ncbi:MAG: hypothetical protein ABJA83_09190 [Burkholderiaceae bacterium]
MPGTAAGPLLLGAVVLGVIVLGVVVLGVMVLGDVVLGVAVLGVMVLGVELPGLVPVADSVLVPGLALPIAPPRAPVIVLPRIDAFPVESTPNADKVFESSELLPVMPSAWRNLCNAALVLGPMTPSTGPGL